MFFRKIKSYIVRIIRHCSMHSVLLNATAGSAMPAVTTECQRVKSVKELCPIHTQLRCILYLIFGRILTYPKLNEKLAFRDCLMIVKIKKPPPPPRKICVMNKGTIARAGLFGFRCEVDETFALFWCQESKKIYDP